MRNNTSSKELIVSYDTLSFTFFTREAFNTFDFRIVGVIEPKYYNSRYHYNLVLQTKYCLYLLLIIRVFKRTNHNRVGFNKILRAMKKEDRMIRKAFVDS